MVDILTQEEIESLLGKEAEAKLSAKTADDLHVIHLQLEGISAKLIKSLSTLLRTSVKIELDRVESHFYGDCVKSIKGPACCTLVRASSWQTPGLLIVEGTLVLPMVDRLLGSTATSPTPLNRTLTELESNLLRRILDAIVVDFRNALNNSLPSNLMLEQVEGSEQLLQELPLYVRVVVIRFELMFGNANGSIHICLPWSILDDLKNHRESKPEGFDGKDFASDQISLRVGDVLSTEVDANGQLVVFVNGLPQFHAAEVSTDGRPGMKIVTRLSES